VQHGINNVVATLGTAITREHLIRLFRKVSQIIFCFDGDAAGQKAAWRALEMALPLLKEGRQVHFMFLPLETDPDTFVRHQGVQAFQHLLAQAIPISDFLFNRLKQRVNFTLNNPEIQATLVEQAKPLLMQMPNGSYRELMLQKLAELTHLPHAKLSQLLYAKTEATPTQIKEVRRKSIREYSLIHQAIIYLLHQPRLVQFVELPKLSWLQQQHPEGKILLTLIEFMKTHPQLKLGTILEHWRGTEYEPIFEQLAAQEMSLETIEDDVFKDVMKGLGQQYVNQRLAELDSKITQLTDEERQEYELLRNTKSSNPSLVGWIPGIQ
jgi:DNA primase